MYPPRIAPGMLPSPPRITMTKAFIPRRAPIVGEIIKMGATRQAAAAAVAVEMAKVREETQLTLIPTSMAPSRFWATASMVVPGRGFFDEDLEQDDQDDRGHDDEEPLIAHGDPQHFHDAGVRIGDSPPLRTPEDDHAGFQNDQGADGGDKRIDVGLVLQGAVDDPFDQHPDREPRITMEATRAVQNPNP